MTTLPNPKSLAPSPAITTDTFTRPASEFDAGINASTAWVAEQADRDAGLSISDDEEETDTGAGRAARALYAFEGKPEFRELIMSAGDELDILKEELDDGWSLANVNGKVGLIPRSYYAFTSEMTSASSLLSPGDSQHQRASSRGSLTPRNSPRPGKAALPLQPQTTGEWYSFPSFRQSLLGGKTLNRFSSFVTTGAEDWVLKGTSTDLPVTAADAQKPPSVFYNDGEDDDDKESQDPHLSQPDRHFIDHGPAWKPKIPSFRVMVHSPSKRSSGISASYTVYLVTSLFFPTEAQDSINENLAPPTRITVHRRFSHFVFLHTALTRRLPGIALPPLPEKQYAGRFSLDFVEARRGDLERYLSRVIRHPVARYAEVLTFFLGCESEIEWKRLLPHHLVAPPAGGAFYSRVYHPAFNLDAEDAVETVDRFQNHVKAVDKSVQSLRGIFQKVRDTRLEMSNVQRLFSYGLLSLITSTPIAGGSSTPGIGKVDEDDEENHTRKGLMNDEGAWCWQEECEDCLKLTKALQKTAETLQSVADLHDDSARRRQLASHETLKDLAHPSALYASVVETHRATLARYKEAVHVDAPHDEVAARCETVLNTTMAEIETYHHQKVEDFKRFASEHLDGEIEFYDQILTRLRGVREAFNEPQYSTSSSTPRQPSMYERELPMPRLPAPALSQPCPHVFDSAPMRPVSVAIGGMTLLLGGNRGSTTGVSRASVLGKFW
ncbi:hypothetical protein JB92DRAFT_2807841 [Gautieria morchelliformis]|nr:hypothetical protein JB92DRAFT_2807841 [Gautieria morchelliformis]